METLYDLYQFVRYHSVATGLGSFIIAVALEKSKTIKFNPFSFIGDLLTGRVMEVVKTNHEEDKKARKEMNDRISCLEQSLSNARQDSTDRYNESCRKYDELKDEMKFEIKSSNMKQYRVDFFRFAEGVKDNKYTKEHWHNIRNKINEYRDFCEDNKNL